MLSFSHLLGDSRKTLSPMYRSSFSSQIFWSFFAGLSETWLLLLIEQLHAVGEADSVLAVEEKGECTLSGSPSAGDSTALVREAVSLPLSGGGSTVVL